MYYDNLDDDDLEILEDFVDESEEGLGTVAALFTEFATKPGDKAIVDAVFRPIHSIKGNSAFLGLIASKHLAHETESVLDLVRKDKLIVSEAVLHVLNAAVVQLKHIMTRIRARQPEVSDKQAFKDLLQKMSTVRREPVALVPEPNLAETAEPAATTQTAAAVAPDAAATQAAGLRDRKLRIRETAVHALEQLAASLAALPQELPQTANAVADRLQSLVADLQYQIQALWDVPVDEFLQRVPRIVADVCRSNGKQIRTHIAETDIALDRRILAILEAPLLHIVRNAADHGVETGAERTQKGKTVQGNIWIQFTCSDAEVVLKIIDDGGGIDYRELARKAIRGGLWPRDRKLTPADLNSLLFLPGLSTAATISDVSGRGVGMDVVKTQIEQAGGSIRIASKPDKGTAVEIRLPAKLS